MSDADTGTETERVITVIPGSSRGSTLAALYRAVDEFYSDRPAVDVQVESDTGDQDSDIRADERIRSSSDDSAPNSDAEGGATDTGGSSPPSKHGGTPSDDGTPGDPDNTPEPPSGSDVESAPTERTEPEGEQGEGEQTTSRFHFAPLFHSRGDRID